MNIDMSFSSLLDSKYDIYEEIYLKIANVVFSHLSLDDSFIFEVNLVDKSTIWEINKTYRGIDRPTDVISFAFEDNIDISLLKSKDKLPRDLGEILICVEKASEQANEYGHSFEREMAFLFVHGLLHLLGYDHMTEEDEKIMFSLQDQILKIYGI